MSLLDDVSIVVTPNGYKEGELYAVVPVPTEGSEEVTNGDFATDSDWTFSGTSFSAGAILFENGADYAFQSWSDTVNTLYKLTITKTGSGTLRFRTGYAGSAATRIDIPESGIVYFTSTSDTNRIQIFGDSGNVNATLNSVSVKEYTSADMDVTRATAATRVDEDGLVNYAEIIGSEEVTDGNFPLPNTNWILGGSGSNIPIIGTNDVAINSVDGNSYIQQSGILTSGKYYKITYDVISASATSNVLKLASSFGMGSIPTSVGTQIVYGTAVTSNLYIERYSNGVNATITNVSVKEVTRDNVPRIDYTGGGCPHILAEPQRTNELIQSNQFDTTWVQSGTLTSGQDGVGGSTDAWKFENPNSTSSMFQYDTTSGVQTLSAYFKKNSNYGVRFYAFGSVNCWAWFDLNNGTVVSTGSSTAKIETAGDDWFRCSMTFDQTNTRCDFYVTNNASIQVLGDYTIQYAQLEAGSYATSYIPTSGSTVTRNQDIFTRDGIGSLINSTEGVLFLEMAKHNGNTVAPVISLNNGTSSQTVALYYFSTDEIYFDVISSSPTVSGGIGGFNTYNFNKIALKYKSGDIALWVNGVEVLTKTNTISLTGLNKISFDYGDGTYSFFGKVKQLQVYNTALTDEQLLQLTGTSGTDFYESYAEMASALTYTIQ